MLDACKWIVMIKDKKVLIFDLGGVLIDLHVERSFAELAAMGVDSSLLTEHNSMVNGYMQKYDRGDITTEEMFSAMASLLPEKGAVVLNGRLHDMWNMMLGKYMPYKFHRLRELRERGHRVVMLSNTNEAHWGELENRFMATMGEPLSAFFDAFYLSYRMRMRKPEHAIFQELIAAENVAACECVFFDDSAENCEAARELGIEAVLMERNAPWGDILMKD